MYWLQFAVKLLSHIKCIENYLSYILYFFVKHCNKLLVVSHIAMKYFLIISACYHRAASDLSAHLFSTLPADRGLVLRKLADISKT